MSYQYNHSSFTMPTVFLHDNEYMLRKTFGLFASETNLAKIVETSEIAQAKIKLFANPFDMVIIGFDNWFEEIHLIELVRDEMTPSKKDIPIIVIVPNVTSNQIDTLKQLNVAEILLKPARIKTIQKAFLNSFTQISTI